MFQKLKNLFSKKVINLPPKDPNDFSLTPSSKYWLTESYCPHCKASICIDEVIADICDSCGEFGLKKSYYSGEFQRTFRQMWDGQKWIWQYKYPEKKMVFKEERYTGTINYRNSYDNYL